MKQLVLVSVISLALTGCATNSQNGQLLGAVTGAAVGKTLGGTGGAIIGAAIGAESGRVVGQSVDNQPVYRVQPYPVQPPTVIYRAPPVYVQPYYAPVPVWPHQPYFWGHRHHGGHHR